MPGTLFVVATPIGNLEDLTFRALRTLREVDLVAAEDTRRTSKLLAHYEIRKPLVSVREHNEARETPALLDRIAAGEDVALVTDAGTPTIADPGARMVRAAHERKIKVVPIPGASAVATALSVSGMPGDQFVFLGFPPASGAARQRWLEGLAKESRVAVFFEAPHRITRTMDDVASHCGERPIIVCRELSKTYEELVVWQKQSSIGLRQAGEFTVVVGMKADEAAMVQVNPMAVLDMFDRLTNNEVFSRDDATKIVASSFAIGVEAARKIIKKTSILVKRQEQSRP